MILSASPLAFLGRIAVLVAVTCPLACGEKRSGSGEVQMSFRHHRSAQGAQAETQIATFGDDSITAQELQERFLEMTPYGRARYQTPEQKRDYVDSMARFEMLVAEAVRRGIHQDAEVVESAKRVMVQRLLQKELDETPTPVPDSAVAEYYQTHQADYVKPEMIRLSHLYLAAPKSDSAAHAKVKNRAAELCTKAKALAPMDFAGFAQMVRDRSEEPKTKSSEGDMRTLSMAELTEQYGNEVAQASKELTQVGQVSNVVEVEAGFHILKLQGRQAMLNLSLEQVKTQIQNTLIREQRMKNYQALLDRLKAQSKYFVDEAALSKLQIDLSAPTQESKRPPPGMIPAPQPVGASVAASAKP
jgi:peptidyl-prolyl cis-trans isomerase C